MDFFSVSDECLELGLRAGAIVLRDVRISDADLKLREEIAEEVAIQRNRLSGLAEVRSLPQLRVLFDIFRGVGTNPRKQPPSTVKLFQYVLRRGDLPAINNLVDAYNLMSVRTKCSLGAHDLGRISAPVELRLFRGDETFTPLGSDEEKEIAQGEFGYVDAENRVLCRLDVVQAEFSKVTAGTEDVILIIEGTIAYDREAFESVFENTVKIIKRHCGGEADIVAFPE